MHPEETSKRIESNYLSEMKIGNMEMKGWKLLFKIYIS